MRTRIRTIKPDFYGDEKICSLSIQARFTAVGMINLADDRGRLKLWSSSIRGFVYPDGKASLRQVEAWISEIVEVQLLLRYECGKFAYGWFRHFWTHQVINRPTESDLPPHPCDPYASFTISEAIKLFKTAQEPGSDASLNDQGELTPSRAGARSSSYSSSGSSSSTKDEEQSKPARPPSKRAKQDAPPLSLPGELHDSAHLCLTILQGVQAERGGNEPTIRGVGLSVSRFPNRDHVRVARELEHWALAGTGQSKPVKDWSRTFGTFLERSPAGKPVQTGDVVPFGRPSAGDLIRKIREAEEAS